jgi:hypothetical protein
MSDIGAVAPADRHAPTPGRQSPERDGDKKSKPRPREPKADGAMVEVEPHKLDIEA